MSRPLTVDQTTDILGLVDIQPTFMPGGELPVAHGDEVVAVANRLVGQIFSHGFATQDWHPADHSSFASNHPGRRPYETIAMPYGEQVLWPDHAVQGTRGAELHPALDQSKIEIIVRKGYRRQIDSYSAFFENDRRTSTGLAGYLRERGLRRLFLVGLATDFCVAYSAEDAVSEGFSVFVVEDGCRGIALPLGGGQTSIDAAKHRLLAEGVHFIASDDLVVC
jgi:nicotinamidase/pyrazinamidase